MKMKIFIRGKISRICKNKRFQDCGNGIDSELEKWSGSSRLEIACRVKGGTLRRS
jgi:hypothetical protein